MRFVFFKFAANLGATATNKCQKKTPYENNIIRRSNLLYIPF